MPRKAKEVRNSADGWREMYALLVAFVDREGHSRVPDRHFEGGHALGSWVRHQRRARKRLSPKIRQMLEALPGWSWDVLTDWWDETFDLLCEFVEREGHALVPYLYMEGDVALGYWVMRQRQYKRSGRLSVARQKRLEGIPGWEWNPRRAGRNSLVYAPSSQAAAELDQLAEAVWKTLFGRGPLRLPEAIASCATQLFEDGLIDSDLASAGDSVDPLLREAIDLAVAYEFLDQPRDGFYRAIIAPAEYYEPEDWELCLVQSAGDTPQTRSEAIQHAARWARENLGLDASEVQVGSFIFEQLEQALGRLLERGELAQVRGGAIVRPRQGRLEGERIGLEASRKNEDSVPSEEASRGADRPPEQKPRRRIVTLIVEDDEESDGDPAPRARPSSYRSSPNRHASLALEEQWDRAFKQLEKYVVREGHAQPPKRYKDQDGFPLGQWVCEQRKARRTIRSDRRNDLEQLPGWAWSARRVTFEEGYENLVHFVEREGHTSVPAAHQENGFPLGVWVRSLRARQAKLSPRRRAALEHLPGWVWSVV